jgi:hypothetical protein
MAMLLMLQLGVTKTMEAQKNFWSLYPTVINFTAGGATSTLPGTLISQPYYAENSVHVDGTLQFYVRNSGSFEVMDQFGNTYAPANNTISNKELEVVPVPGSCDTYCVMFTEPFGTATSKFAFFEIQVKGDGTLNVYPVQKKTTVYSGIITGIAVSKRIGSSADRYIYIVGGTLVDRYVISTTGINFDQQYDLSSYHYNADDIYEADLSPDGLYLGWGSSDKDVYVMTTDLGVLNEITLSGPLFVQQITGVEFHAIVEGGTSLYASMSGSGVFEIDDFATSTPTITAIAGSRYLGTSQLELALNGLIYCVESQNGRLSTIDPLSHTINTLTTTVTSSKDLIFVKNWALPQQIDGEGDALFLGVDPPTISNLNIEGTALPTSFTSIPSFFNCSDIRLNYTATGVYDDITIEIVSVNPITGTPIPGLNYSITLPSTTTLPIDLRCLDDVVNCDLFDSYLGGSFLITVTLDNTACESQASVQGFFEVFGAPTPITVDLDINSGSGITYDAVSSVDFASAVGNKGGSFDISNSSGDIDYFRVTIVQVDCSTGADIATLLAQVTNTPFPSSGNANYNFNTLEINGSQGYFGGNPVDGNCYRFEVTLGNVCGEASALTYIIFDASMYLQNGSNNSNRASATVDRKNQSTLTSTVLKAQVIPQPAQQQAWLKLDQPYTGEFVLTILNSKGQILTKVADKMANGQCTLPIGSLPSGLYYYQLQLPEQLPLSGKIIKQ